MAEPGIGVNQMSEDELLDVMKSMMDIGWWGPLEFNSNSGWEILQGYAAQMSAVSSDVSILSREGHVSYAKGGAKASVTLTFSRTNTTDLTLEIGLPVFTEWGTIFLTTNEVSWSGGDSSDKTVEALALREGYTYNVPADSITQLRRPTAKELGDTSLTVTNVSAVTDGVTPMLDYIVPNRGLTRLAGESDESLRKRFRTLRDAKTPAAIKRACDIVFEPLGLTYTYIEGHDKGMFLSEAGDTDHESQGYVDVGSDSSDPNKGLFTRMLLSQDDSRRCFVIFVPEVGALGEYGVYCNESGDTQPAPKYNYIGETGDDINSGFVDGSALERDNLYAELYRLMEEKRAPGIRFHIVHENYMELLDG